MKTLAEIEKIKKQLVEEWSEDVLFAGTTESLKEQFSESYLDGFDACLALMLERERMAKERFERIIILSQLDRPVQMGDVAREALERLK